MATTIPVHQAIKFYSEADDVFNETNECPCGELNEKWEYIIKPGDITEVQITTGCTEVTYDADIIVNGSFEIQGIAPSDAADWMVDDTEKVERANDDPYIGQWAMRWNVVDTGTATQDTGVAFLDGDVYLLEFYVKVVNPVTSYNTPLEVYVGGQNYEVTPTEDYTKITIPVVFLDNGIDEDIIFVASNISPMADFMYVDFVVLRKVNYAENNCFFDLVYNGNFEYGQAKVTGELPVVASFDGWEIDGTVEADVLGGFDGTRCPVMYGTASIGQTWNVMADGNTYTIKFMAKAATAGDEITVTIGATLIDTFTLTTQWEEYELEYTASDDLTTLTFGTTDNEIYLDNVSITLVNFVNDDSIYVHDVDNDVYYTDPITTNEFEGGYNALFDWDEILDEATPGCLQIITEFADENLLSNGKFELGTGDVFTGWNQFVSGGGTITQTVSGGLVSSRAVQLNLASGSSICELSQVPSPLMEVGGTYVLSLWAKQSGASSGMLSIGDGLTGNTFGSTVLTNTFKRYTFEFTYMLGQGNNIAITAFGSLFGANTITIDNMFLSQNGEGVHYSDLFKYDKTGGVCAPEIVWYDSQDEVFGIDYESGFKNKLRIKDLNFQVPSYPTDDFVKTLNGLESSISRAVVKKQKTMNVTPSPEFIHDRLAVAVRHTNIEVDTIPYCSVEETIYTPVDSETGCRLKAAQVILGIEGEILAERSINCEE